LSAAYLYPALVEQDLIHHEYVENTWPYHNTYVFVHALYNLEGNRGFFHLVDGIWLFGLIGIVAAAAVLLIIGRKRLGFLNGLAARAALWTVIGLAATFMMTKASYPVGRLIPKIEIGVFTWRMLSITTLIGGLLAGACVEAGARLFRARRRALAGAGFATAAFIVLGGAALSLLGVMKPTFHAPEFVPEEEHLNWATIPKTATGDPTQLPDDIALVELGDGNGDVSVVRWDPEHREIRANLTSEDTVMIRTFNFPGWTATVDGEPAEISTGEDLSDIQIEVAAGDHDIRVDFLPTPARRLGSRITALDLCFLVGLTIVGLFMSRVKGTSE